MKRDGILDTLPAYPDPETLILPRIPPQKMLRAPSPVGLDTAGSSDFVLELESASIMESVPELELPQSMLHYYDYNLPSAGSVTSYCTTSTTGFSDSSTRAAITQTQQKVHEAETITSSSTQHPALPISSKSEIRKHCAALVRRLSTLIPGKKKTQINKSTLATSSHDDGMVHLQANRRNGSLSLETKMSDNNEIIQESQAIDNRRALTMLVDRKTSVASIGSSMENCFGIVTRCNSAVHLPASIEVETEVSSEDLRNSMMTGGPSRTLSTFKSLKFEKLWRSESQISTNSRRWPDSRHPPSCSSVPLEVELQGNSLTSHEKKLEYKKLKRLGKGSQGVIFLACHQPSNQLVALKAINIFASKVDPNPRASFRREVAILQQTKSHASIIRLLDFWEGQGNVYQVLEACLGGDLDASFPFGEFPESKTKLLLHPIFDAIRFLHEDLGIVHRDLRTSNLLLRRPITGLETPQELSSLCVLADLGIATLECKSGRVAPDYLIAPAYLAPEMMQGGRFTKASDMFGLGVCLFKILMGRNMCISDHGVHRFQGEYTWRRLSLEGRDLLRRCTAVNRGDRIKALDAANHSWFT
ncbi:kinase-like domain-containing protein [Obelidium mucronatum]|nr:kinase-like domain-containing protein [Obelidium mucronatum]